MENKTNSSSSKMNENTSPNNGENGGIPEQPESGSGQMCWRCSAIRRDMASIKAEMDAIAVSPNFEEMIATATYSDLELNILTSRHGFKETLDALAYEDDRCISEALKEVAKAPNLSAALQRLFAVRRLIQNSMERRARIVACLDDMIEYLFTKMNE